MGLKENVIIGKLIPAGTGLDEVEAELIRREQLENGIVPTEEEIADPAEDALELVTEIAAE